LQSRLDAPPPSSPLDRLLGDARPETHGKVAEALLDASSLEEALARALLLADSLPAVPDRSDLRVAASEVAG